MIWVALMAATCLLLLGWLLQGTTATNNATGEKYTFTSLVGGCLAAQGAGGRPVAAALQLPQWPGEWSWAWRGHAECWHRPAGLMHHPTRAGQDDHQQHPRQELPALGPRGDHLGSHFCHLLVAVEVGAGAGCGMQALVAACRC